MRGGASLLLGFAIVAACGHPFDTSVQPDPVDGGVEGGLPPSDAAPPLKEASVGDDDIEEAGIDASASEGGSDAGTDATDATDAGTDSGIKCTSFDETFPDPWSRLTQGWEPPPTSPAFYTTSTAPTFGTVQASSVGSPTSAFLTHAVTPGCRAHLRFEFRMSASANDVADIVIARIASGAGQGIDFIRRQSGPLDAVYGGVSHTIGPVTADTWNTLDVDVPAVGTSENVPILLNGNSPAQPFKMTAAPTQITQLQLGIIQIGTTATNITELVDLDDIEFNL